MIKAKGLKINFDKYNAKTIASIMDDDFIEDEELIKLRMQLETMKEKYETSLSAFKDMKKKNKELLRKKLKENKKKITRLERVIL